KPLRQGLTNQPRSCVRRAAAGKADDNAHWPRWIGLCPSKARHSRERASACGQMQKLPSVGKFHFEPPSPFTSLDHLVGASEQGWGNVKADRVRGLEIDHQFEPGRLLDRKIARVCTAHDFVDVRC